jgi:hypothetical protein
LAIISGIGAAALSFRLLLPLSPALRTLRLLALTLRDLRRLATGPMPWTVNDRERAAYIAACRCCQSRRSHSTAPSCWLAGLSLGTEIIRLRRLAHRFYLDAEFDPMLDALARGDRSAANERLVRLDNRLAAALPGSKTGALVRLRARGNILAMSEALAQHAAYFYFGAAR